MKPSAEKESILVVDDALNTLEVLRRNLTSQKYKVFTADNVAGAVNILDTTPIDLVITDFKMPGASGLDLIRHVRENYKNTKVMMITGYPTVNSAVEAVKTGAEEYLSKPFTDKELLQEQTSPVQDSFKQPMAAQYSWMKSVQQASPRRPSFSVCFRIKKYSCWAQAARLK